MLTFHNLHFKGVLCSNSSSTPAHKALCVDLLSLGAVLVSGESGEQDRPGCPLPAAHTLHPSHTASGVLHGPCPSVCGQGQGQPGIQFQEPPGARLPN